MKSISTLAVVAVLVCLVSLNGWAAEALDQKAIRCKVCERAIEHIWDKGEVLRKKCHDHPESDPRCDFSAMHAFGIEEMAHAACENLPKTHQALDHSEFDMVPHQDPQHTAEAVEAIEKSCKEWLHDEHGAENIALYIYANLDAHKSKDTILHSLQHRFCRVACDPSAKRKRDRHDEL